MKKLLLFCSVFFTLLYQHAPAQNRCLKQLLFDDFNSNVGWTQVGSTTSISGGTFNFMNTTGGVYDRQFKFVPGLSTYSTTFIAKCQVNVTKGNGPGHHILTLFENGSLDPVSYDASGGYAATVNDAVLVDITAQYPPSSSTSNPNPNDPNNLWQFNLRYKKGTVLTSCPAKINFPALNTWYYVQLERGGNNLKLSVFSDPAYSVHIPGSPICFQINANLNPLNYVNLGVYTWAGGYRALTGKIDSLSVCQGIDNVVCTPPCDTSCHLKLNMGGVSGGPFSCGSTIKLNCNKTYDFAPQINCNGSTSSVVGVALTDPSGNTPPWAASFISFNGNGTLIIPGGITQGNYTLTYYYGAGGNVCDSCKFKLFITCKPCNCTLTNKVQTSAGNKKIKCGDTLTLACGTTDKFTPSLECNGDPNTHMLNLKIFDIYGNTPSWVNASFFTNLGNGNLVIPAGVNGYFTLRYIWGKNCQPCDSCSYTLKIQCCGTLAVNAGQDIATCCPSNGTQLNAVASGGASPYSYSWSPVTGLNNPNIPNPICTTTGTYTVTVTDANGCRVTDQITISYSGVNCCRLNKTKSQAMPNPFTNGFTLKLPPNAIANVQVIDLHGTSLETKMKASGSLQMGGRLAYGAYTIVVSYNDGTREEMKIIKSPK